MFIILHLPKLPLRTAVDICQTRGDVRGIRFDFVGAGSGRVEERGAGNGYDDQVSKHLVSLEVSAKGLSRLPARDEHCDSNQLANGCRLENGRSLIQDAAMAGNSSCRFAQKSWHQDSDAVAVWASASVLARHGTLVGCIASCSAITRSQLPTAVCCYRLLSSRS